MIDWQQVDTVLLDMDGTLLDLHFDNYFWLDYLPKRYAEIHGLDEEQSRRELIGRFEAIRGTLNWYCLDYWNEQLQLDICALKREVEEIISIRPYVKVFLQALRDSGKQILLVTNAHRGSLDIKMARTGLAPLFDELISSHDYQSPKEEQSFWQRLQSQHPFDPSRTLFIDDSLAVLRSAQRYGIAQLLSLRQPDSRQAERLAGEFPAILHFDELMPVGAR